MANQVYLDENDFIWEVYDGDQNEERVANEVIEPTNKLIAELQAKQKPVNIIVDVTNFGKSDLGARQVGSGVVKTWPYRKLAVFGPKPFFRSVVSLIILATGRQRTMRIFATREEALDWLHKA